MVGDPEREGKARVRREGGIRGFRTRNWRMKAVVRGHLEGVKGGRAVVSGERVGSPEERGDSKV